MDGKSEQEQEALHLKGLAEAKFKSSNLKSALKYAERAHSLAPNLDGIFEMVTSFKILRIASDSSPRDWYKILQVEPFAHTNTIRKQYKKLALLLHPDKNPHVGSEEAFKVVGEAFRFLCDKIRRKEYDLKLRIRMQEEAVEASKEGPEGETFWTACSTCRLLHQFERRYVGQNLVCPSCKMSFNAVEVENSGSEEEQEEKTRDRNRSSRLRVTKSKQKVASFQKNGDLSLKRKMDSVKAKVSSEEVEGVTTRSGILKRKLGGELRIGDLEREGAVGGWDSGRLRNGGSRRRMSTFGEVLERSKPKRVKAEEETMTLAEMRDEVKRKAQQQRMKVMKLKLKDKDEDKTEKSKQEKSHVVSTNSRGILVYKRRTLKKSVKLEIKEKASIKTKGSKIGKNRDSSEGDLEVMPVEDSDFYDFDKDRVEKSFKKGQVWAAYDDDDGMPRHYALIDEVLSLNPFEVRISWIDLQNNGDEKIINWEKMGFHMSCGRFKVSWKTPINSVNVFSHVVDCERVAREIYRIYPKKGSVWALYNEAAHDAEGRNIAAEKRCYYIVVFLTSYSETTGLSMAYLEKVDGYKTIFKRREIGSHAIRFLEENDIRLISHQIPAQKLSGHEINDVLEDCWELDPASLPSDLLTIGEL
ncbi:hypothetical protein L6164_020419 [Bauhinia variegata]|uniref:Uncharacterized protein n=1 Tax=Bauhinia variegata TaxID=167791 RepID=A0ACB9MWL2_BAUVA|nr:hypothetical protein L6164_020419 [Bauhinia variegata]